MSQLASDPFSSTEFLEVAEGIWSRSFDGHRVDVLVPKNVSPQSPILVMHDGMNVFFSEFASTGQTWEVLESIERGRIQDDPVVVAVWGEGGTQKFNPRRINEFLVDDLFEAQPALWETLEPALAPPTREARGNYMVAIAADQILPAVAERFGLELSATRTAIAGCSVAGIASIYSVAKRPDVFGAAFSFSSHWQFGGEELVEFLANQLPTQLKPLIWADSGTEGLDAGSVRLNERFGELLQEKGWGEQAISKTFNGTGHSESFWASRLDLPVNWWLSKQR
ncbi:MAG: alpha/beta hydrolase-fold protein [Rhodoluna sp.]|nr:alpha/beta hydrolase-fold protein [Rhodoluna sp.]